MLKIKEQKNVGNAKYIVSYYTGKKHDDGSDFYDIRIFKSKKKKDEFIYNLRLHDRMFKNIAKFSNN